jgi:hypothetical protein
VIEIDSSESDLPQRTEALRRDVEASRTRTVLLLMGVTFLLLFSLQVLLGRATLSRQRPELILASAIAPNALAWLVWGASHYLSFFLRWRFERAERWGGSRYEIDELQYALYQLRRQRRLEAIISILLAIQVGSTAFLFAFILLLPGF